MPADEPAGMVATSYQVPDRRCWRTTVREVTRLLDRRPEPSLRSVAVKVTIDPAATVVFEADSASVVGTSRQVLYGVVEFVMSYCCWSVATSHRPNAWAFQPDLGFVLDSAWTTASP